MLPDVSSLITHFSSLENKLESACTQKSKQTSSPHIESQQSQVHAFGVNIINNILTTTGLSTLFSFSTPDPNLTQKVTNTSSSTLRPGDLLSDINQELTSTLEEFNTLHAETNEECCTHVHAITALSKTAYEHFTRISKTNPQDPEYQNRLETLQILVDKVSELDKTLPQVEAVHAVSMSTIANTNLHQAINKNSLEALKQAIAEGADVNSRGKGNKPALIHAIANGSEEMCRLLIEHGASMDYPDLKMQPLDQAVLRDNKEICKLLIDSGAKINDKTGTGFSPFLYAAKLDRLEILELFLANGADVTEVDKATGKNCMHFAVENGSSDMCQFLLYNTYFDCDIADKDGNTPLCIASNKNQEEMCSLLIKAGADVQHRNARNMQPLHFAIDNNAQNIAKLLIDAGAEINTYIKGTYSSFLYAIATGQMEMCKFLLDEGADIFQKDEFGRTCLHVAGQNNHPDIYAFLLSRGVNPHIVDETGDLPLDKAVRSNTIKKISDFIHPLTDTLSLQAMQEHTHRKLLGHTFELGEFIEWFGNSPLTIERMNEKIHSMQLNGCQPELFWSEFYKSFKSISAVLPDFLDNNLISMLAKVSATASEKNSPQELFATWKKGLPVIIHTGHVGHHIGILIYGDRIVKLNRGEGISLTDYYTNNCIKCHNFDRDKMTPEIIAKIIHAHDVDYKASSKILDQDLPQDLSFSQTDIDHAIESMTIPPQITGNCSFANSEGIIWPILFLYKLKQNPIEETFPSLHHLVQDQKINVDTWQSYYKLTLVEAYLKSCSDPDRIFTPEWNLIAGGLVNGVSTAEDPILQQRWQRAHEEFLKIAPSHIRLKYLVTLAAAQPLTMITQLVLGKSIPPSPILPISTSEKYEQLKKTIEDLFMNASLYKWTGNEWVYVLKEDEAKKASDFVALLHTDDATLSDIEAMLNSLETKLFQQNLSQASAPPGSSMEALFKSYNKARQLLSELRISA